MFIDNLVQLLLIASLCGVLCGMTGDESYLLTRYILPGAAVSILLGNLFYAWQAHRLARRENRSDVTALPYGINTPSLLVYVFFVMAPTFRSQVESGKSPAEAAELAWKLGLVACLGSGVIEFAGSFVAESVRRRTPRAALLSTLAGIAIGFIAMSFALQIFQKPLIAMLPLAIVLITYFSQASFPLQLPGGMLAVAIGTLCAWLLTLLHGVWPAAPEWLVSSRMAPDAVQQSLTQVGWVIPSFVGSEIVSVLRSPEQWLGLLSVIVPMGLFNLVGSLQNIESAEAGGDRYSTRSSLAVNGIGTIAAACFGSCFPTTIYIGHPGWKGLGARAGYSTLNGIVVTILCLTGSVGFVSALVPLEAGVAIVLWIGIIITAQAFAATPREHAPAVAVGLFPAIAAWGFTVAQGAFFASGGKTMQELLVARPQVDLNGYLLAGLISMERGYIFTCMMLAAISAFLIDRKFVTAAVWSLVAAACAATGLTHAYSLQGNVVDFLFVGSAAPEGSLAVPAWGIAWGYLAIAILFITFSQYLKAFPQSERVEH